MTDLDLQHCEAIIGGSLEPWFASCAPIFIVCDPW
jgi:hypothetical protein